MNWTETMHGQPQEKAKYRGQYTGYVYSKLSLAEQI